MKFTVRVHTSPRVNGIRIHHVEKTTDVQTHPDGSLHIIGVVQSVRGSLHDYRAWVIYPRGGWTKVVIVEASTT